MRILKISVIFICFLTIKAFALPVQSLEKYHFNVIPLGTSGGEFQNNLSAYLVAPADSNQWVVLDAGTLCSEINNIPLNELHQLNIPSANNFFLNKIKAYLISHAHLDHINGLVICSTIDSKKEIMGISTTIEYMREHIFNWKIWPNFTNEGQEPMLKQYHYSTLILGKNTLIPETKMQVKAFPLNHGNGYPSSAFLLQANNRYLLYLGDTGADAIEHSQDLHHLWQDIAPLIREHKLDGLFIESSYSNERADTLLFGHLKPKWVLAELFNLAQIVDSKQPKAALRGLKVVITHIKQGFGEKDHRQEIIQELRDRNELGVEFILPQQGKLMRF